jgi:nicotinamidase-related amidase
MYELFGKPICESVEEIVAGGGVALVMVDVLNDFYHRDGFFPKAGWSLDDLDASLRPLRELLDSARAAGVPVIHAQNTVLPDGQSDSSAFLRFKTKYSPTVPIYNIDGTWGWEFLDGFGPGAGELVVKKHRPSAFVGSDLDQLLRANRIQSVILAGCVTEGCVQATAIDAMFRDYYTIIVRDCVASYDRVRHDEAIKFLAPRVEIVDSTEIIEALAGANGSLVRSPRERAGAESSLKGVVSG